MNDFVSIVHEPLAPIRTFVLVGHTATTSPDFSLDNLPGTGGRMDLIARCIRASFLVAGGIRRNVVLYIVLLGGPNAPRTLRLSGNSLRFVRPDERRIAGQIKRALRSAPPASAGFQVVGPGVAAAAMGLEGVLNELAGWELLLLDETGRDFDVAGATGGKTAFVLGDHLGLLPEETALLVARGARKARLGPVSVHADDALAIVHNALDRRDERACPAERCPRVDARTTGAQEPAALEAGGRSR